MIRKATETATSWVDVIRLEGEPDAHSGGRGRGGGPEVGGELGDERLQGDSAILLELGEMVAVDDGERVDPALDRGIGGGDLLVGRAARVDVEQGGDDLEIVLHPVMDFAHQLGLALDRGFELGLVAGEGLDRPVERLAQLPDLPRRRGDPGEGELAVAGPVGGDGALHPRQRPEQQAVEDQPSRSGSRRPTSAPAGG